MKESFFNSVPTVTSVVNSVYSPPVKRFEKRIERSCHGFVFYKDPDYFFRYDSGLDVIPEKNSIVYLPPNRDYTVVPMKRVSEHGIHVINFLADAERSEPFVFTPRSPGNLLSLFESCERSFKAKKSGYEAKCISCLYEIISILTSDAYASYLPSTKAAKIAPAVDYIKENYTAETPSVTHLSKLCGISEVYLRQLFSEEFGLSPVKYINSLRITLAKELLLSDTFGSIDAVAAAAGFTDPCYFRRVFKYEVGISPGAYRKTTAQ